MSDKEEKKNDGSEQFYQVGAFSGPSSRLPNFYKTNPTLWFLQVEAIFSTSRVTSPQIRFQAAVSGLDEEVLTQIADLFATSKDDPYTLMKERLISIYGESETRRIQKLLEDTQLGSQKPSQLYRQMLQLAGSIVSTEVVRTLWLRNLPLRVQEILAATRQEDVEALTETADKIMEVERPPDISMVTQRGPSSSQAPSDPRFAELLEGMRKLQVEVAELRQQQNRSRSRERNQNQRYQGNRNRSRYRSKSRNGLCYYHSRFKKDARKCTQPCRWKTLND